MLESPILALKAQHAVGAGAQDQVFAAAGPLFHPGAGQAAQDVAVSRARRRVWLVGREGSETLRSNWQQGLS